MSLLLLKILNVLANATSSSSTLSDTLISKCLHFLAIFRGKNGEIRISANKFNNMKSNDITSCHCKMTTKLFLDVQTDKYIIYAVQSTLS